jgi:dihydroxyacetone kinase-like protein
MPKTSLSKDEVKAMLILACERIIAAEPDAVPSRP